MNNRNILEYLHKLGVPMQNTEYRAQIDQWESWYRGKVEKFHAYNVFNGITTTRRQRASLTMAKTVAEDWANLLLNERVQIAVEGEADQALIDDLLTYNRFPVDGNRAVEWAFALGTAGFSEYLDADGLPRIDYHKATQIWPIRWEGARVTECAFASVGTDGQQETVFVRMYKRNERGLYVIENHLLNGESGNEMDLPEDVAPLVETGSERPLFQIVTPNIANNIDTTCPMGISVYANAVDALKAVDAVYDSYVNEYLLGRKRLMVPMSMVQVERSRDGESVPLFDPQDAVYTAFQPADGQKADFHDFSPEIRSQAHMDGMRAALNTLSFKCGLGTGRYEFDRQGGVRTATEVISEQSDLYQALCKHEIVLRDALTSLTRALLFLAGRKGDAEVTITFDDSIIQDKAAQREDARKDVQAGLMSKYRYLTTIAGLSEEDAAEELQRIRSESSVTAEAVDFFNVNNAE